MTIDDFLKLNPDADFEAFMHGFYKQFLIAKLKQNNFKILTTARALKINRGTLQTHIKKYEVL